jgi:VWFA-related protein
VRAVSQVLIAIFCCSSLPGFAQKDVSPGPVTPPTESPAGVALSADRRITLDIVVTDKSGHPVPGLQQQDFTLLDDKQPQSILSFRAVEATRNAADVPQQAILLADAVNASFQSLGSARQQVEKFLRQDGGHLLIPMSVLFLTDTSTQVQPVATSDGNALADSMNSTQSSLRSIGRSQGFYGGADRVRISLRTLEGLAAYEATQPGRKLLIWLSPGWPLLSGANVELSKKDQDSIFNLVVELSAALRAARITLYSVDPLGLADAGGPETFYYQSFLKGVPSANRVQNGNLGLQVLAAQSGGRVLNSSNDIASSIAGCVSDATAFYTLTFDSPPADHPNEYHSLQVKIDKSGLTARTRTGYYAQR